MSSEKKFLPKLYPIKREIGKTWFVLYTAADGSRQKIYGNLNHLPTVELRLQEAERIIQKILKEKAIKPPTGPGNQLIKDLTTVYELRIPGCRPKTVSAYQTHFNSFARWYRENGCPQMTALEAVQYLNYLTASGCSATTRNNYKANIKSLFHDLTVFFKARYPDNPFAGIKKLRESRKTKNWFRPEQIEAILPTILKDGELHLAISIMYHCFARPNEIRLLRIGDINFDTRKLRIESNAAKTAKIRFVPIPAELLEQLQKLRGFPEQYYIFSIDGLPGAVYIGRDTHSKRHKKMLQRLGFPPGYTFYSWKNTGAVKMLMQDRVPMRYISKCMGHHSLDMTDRYFESLGVDEMGDAIQFPELFGLCLA